MRILVYNVRINIKGGSLMQKRCNVTIDEKTLNRLDLFADMNGLTRSSVISIAVNQYIGAMEQLPSLQAQLSEMQILLKDLQPKKLK